MANFLGVGKTSMDLAENETQLVIELIVIDSVENKTQLQITLCS